jgi:hypothetical protein
MKKGRQIKNVTHSTFIVVFVSYSVGRADYGMSLYPVTFGHVTSLFVSTICFFKYTAHHDLRNKQSMVGLELYSGKKRLAEQHNFLLFFLYLDCRLVSRRLWHRLEVDCLSSPILYKIIASDVQYLLFIYFLGRKGNQFVSQDLDRYFDTLDFNFAEDITGNLVGHRN